MKLATIEHGEQQKLCLVDSETGRVFDLAAADRRAGGDGQMFASMLALIDAGEAGLDAARGRASQRGGDDDLWLSLDDVIVLAPLPEPRQMRDAMSFGQHILQSDRSVAIMRLMEAGDLPKVGELLSSPFPDLPEIYRKRPIYYLTNRFAVQGTNTAVHWPRYSKVMDYELEFGIVTMGRATNLSAAQAGAHIFGYTIFNDFSARDEQGIEMAGKLGPSKGKSFDGGNVLGPWIVTPDEICDPYSLHMEARVNGRVWSQNTSKDMLFSFEETLAFITKDETVHPGEFIGSGTVGNGCGLEQARFLSHGDRVELEVEKIGVLANQVLRQDM